MVTARTLSWSRKGMMGADWPMVLSFGLLVDP
jgi:hypothetical protein